MSWFAPADQVGRQAAGSHDRQQDQQGAESPREAVPLEQRHERFRDRRDHCSDDHGDDDHVRKRKDPDQPDQEQHDADEQPGREPQIAEPLRCREDTGELAGIDLDELVLAGLGVSAATEKAAANHRPIPIMMDT
jgi:hypothetical protein